MTTANARRYVVQPVERVSGTLAVPGDKSISHRSLMLGGIAEGLTEVTGFLASEDCLATLAALRALGVRIERPAETEVRVHGVGLRGLQRAGVPLDMGNAGTAMRLSMGLLAGQSFESTLIGDASLMRRPMERVAKPLRLMGARIDTEDGHPPVRLHGAGAGASGAGASGAGASGAGASGAGASGAGSGGTAGGGGGLRGIDYVLPMASAQVKSALLLAGLYAEGVTSVTEPAPTRDHTERMFAGFGVPVQREGGRVSVAGNPRLRACRIAVPGDFSSAAFFMVAGVLAAAPELTIRAVGVNPTRTGLLDLLRLMGADIRVHPHDAVGPEPTASLEIRASRLKGIRVPEALVPLSIDEFPAFFIAAACAEGETVLTGAEELRVKESDRLAVMADGLTRLGVDCTLLPDGIRIRGGQGFSGGRVDSHGDHRIAMSFAIASTRAGGPIEIDDVANVATSFPGFPALARSVGLSLAEV
jgi:3-phosphoshikimate 1-carboxyvinyltransferase